MYFILTFLCDYSYKAGIRNDNDDICILLTAFGVLRNIILQTVLLGPSYVTWVAVNINVN